jgi:hypothetical protein
VNSQLSLIGVCIRGSRLPECAARRDEWIEPRCTQSQLLQQQSRQLFVESRNYTQRQRSGGNDVVVLVGLKLRNTSALLARNYNRPNVKKSSLRAREPFKDVKSAGTDPRLPERSIHVSYNRSK